MFRGAKRFLRKITGKKKTNKVIHPTWLGRVACLGRNVFDSRISDLNHPVLINQQKVRCDLWMDYLSGAPRPDTKVVEAHLDRDYVAPTIAEQEKLPWLDTPSEKISCLIMDSFAELTDQKFVHRSGGWAFCCHYADINHTPEFDENFIRHGLLPIEEIENVYREFFEWFFKTYPNVSIIFFHFPTSLDKREQFHIRAEKILNIIDNLAQRFECLHSVSISDHLVLPHEDDSFAYHFSNATVSEFVKKWKFSK